jgi:type IV secretion system protein VirB4
MAIFLSGAGAASAARRLRDYTPPRRGLVDLIPWAFLVSSTPGAVLNKDGSFTASFEIQGPDRASSTDEDLNALSLHVSRAFGPYTNAWTFHFDSLRRPAPSYPGAGGFPDPVSRFLDDCRRRAYLERGRLFESVAILSVTFRPPREVYQHVLLRFQQGVEIERRTWLDTLATFKEALSALRSRLSGVLRVRPLDGEELLSHLYACLTGRHQLVRDPGPGVYLDQVLSTEHAVAGWEPRIGDSHLALLAFSHLPARLSPAALDALNDVPFAFRLSVRFTPLDTRSAQSIIDSYSRGWFWMQRSARDLLTTSEPQRSDDPFINRHAVDMLHDASDATRINHQGEHRFAYFTANLVVHGETRAAANDHARELGKLLTDRGYTTRLETYNAPAAFHGSLPGQAAANLRTPLVNGVPIADMLPLTAIWPGLSQHPSQFFPSSAPPILIGSTDGSTPFRLFLHSGDLGHAIVVGPPGAGKSTHLAALLLGWLRYPTGRVYLFDRDHSARLLAKALGARYYDIGQEQLSFQPLRYLDSDTQLAVALSWLEALFALQIPKLTPAQSQILATALRTVATLQPSQRTLRVLHSQLQDAELSAALRPFVKDGPYASLLDGSADALAAGRLQIFEMRRLLELEAKAHLPVLLHLLDRIEASLDGSPTLIILDEAGLALLHPVFASRIKGWALTLRKKNAALVLAIQALSQLESQDSFSILLQSCPTRIYLPNPEATSPDVRAVYQACGLNPRQIDQIAAGRKKSDYYLSNPDGSRLYGLALTPAELAFFSTLPGRSLQETHLMMDQHIADHGRRWPAQWLLTCGLPQEAASLDQLLKETYS